MGELKLKHVLRRLMEDQGFTVRKLSKESGVPLGTLSNYLAGGRSSKPEHLRSIARALGVSIEKLCFDEETTDPGFNTAILEDLFSGWLKVNIQRVVSDKKEKGKG